MQKNKELLLQLSLIDQVGPILIQSLLEKIGVDSFVDLHQFTVGDLQKLGISKAKAEQLMLGVQNKIALQRELELIEKHQLQWASILCEDYPNILRHIPGAPAIIYWRGTLPTWPDKALAIVGARKADHYGKSVIDEIVPQLVQAGYAIISGGAVGADAMAHRAALKAGGTTIVVCGTGLKFNYPRSHKKLFDEVAANGGAVLSSFPVAMAGQPGNFPARNRIISGLSLGTLVVQAAKKSGARITAMHALEQGREVFAVPGLFGNPLSEGCHELVQQGAKLIHSAADIFAEFPGTSIGAMQIVRSLPDSEVECKIVAACREPISFDDLQQVMDMPAGNLQSVLFDLQLQGFLAQNFMGQWEIK